MTSPTLLALKIGEAKECEWLLANRRGKKKTDSLLEAPEKNTT